VTRQPDEKRVGAMAATRGLELHWVANVEAWILASPVDCLCPFTLIPDLRSVELVLSGDPAAIKAYTPRLMRSK
jgi:hypothetical protein